MVVEHLLGSVPPSHGRVGDGEFESINQSQMISRMLALLSSIRGVGDLNGVQANSKLERMELFGVRRKLEAG